MKHGARATAARLWQMSLKRRVPDEPSLACMPVELRVAHCAVLLEEAFEVLEALGCRVHTRGSRELITAESLSVTAAIERDGHQLDLVHIAHELTDLAYINETTAAMYGLPTEQLFQEMYRSNATKVLNGHVLRHQSKDPHEQYRPPDIAGVLRSAAADQDEERRGRLLDRG